MTANRHDEEIITLATLHARPAALVAVNLQNLKPLNVVLGHQVGDRLIAETQRRLSGIGRTWRTAGDDFVTLAAGALAEVTEQVQAFSWLMNTSVGATEAWVFRFTDGRRPVTRPWRSFLVSCTPRCGLAEVAADAAAALDLARARCDALGQQGAATPPGFAPLAANPFGNQANLLSPACPACGHGRPTTVKDDLGWSAEKCPRCDASYERTNVLCVLGEESAAGYA
jgi:GGDEF domain-containing protein